MRAGCSGIFGALMNHTLLPRAAGLVGHSFPARSAWLVLARCPPPCSPDATWVSAVACACSLRSVLLSALRWARPLWSDVVVRTRETYPSIERLLRSLKAPTRYKREPYHNLAVSFELLGNGLPPRRMNHHGVGCTLLSVLLFFFPGRSRTVFCLCAPPPSQKARP